PRGLAVLAGPTGPEDVALAADRPLDEGPDVEVPRDRDLPLEVTDAPDVAESVLTTPNRVAGASHHGAERLLRDRKRVAPDRLPHGKAAGGEPGERAVEPPQEAHEMAAASSGAIESRNSSTARANASGRSSMGAWPQSGTSRIVADGMPSRNRIATSR